jgi:hypothetical protein
MGPYALDIGCIHCTACNQGPVLKNGASRKTGVHALASWNSAAGTQHYCELGSLFCQ